MKKKMLNGKKLNEKEETVSKEEKKNCFYFNFFNMLR